MKIKKNNLYIVVIVLIIFVGGYFVLSNGEEPVSNIVGGNGETQKVILSYKDYNYYPQEARVKVNQPVEIFLDESVYGCFRGFTIREFGVSKYLATPEDSVVFTPTEKGTYTFACSMGMGTGTLIVE